MGFRVKAKACQFHTHVMLIALALFATSAQAIVDIESLRLDEQQLGLSGTVSAKLSGKSGNTDAQTYDGAAGLQYVKVAAINLSFSA